jgi:hypothetical protein
MKRTVLMISLAVVVLTYMLVKMQSQENAAVNSAGQMTFPTPEAAVELLIKAASDYDVPTLLKIFGPSGKDLITTADPVQDKNNAAAFAERARQKSVIQKDPKNANKAILLIGDDEFPSPIPLVRKGGKWSFDTAAGRSEVLFRRIGANELDAIAVCRGFDEAQHAYAATTHDDSGVNQYAQKIISTPGKQDGLYWADAEGKPSGPISEPVAKAIAEGYSVEQPGGYHGYFFKVLKGQGPAAPLGALNYVIQGAMIGGFALVAFPADYRVTGVKTFIVGPDGVVYQKDLGPDTLNIAKQMELFNPDKTWQATDDNWPSESE